MRAAAFFLIGIITPALVVLVIDGLAFGAWFSGTVPDWTLAYALPLGLVGGLGGVCAAAAL